MNRHDLFKKLGIGVKFNFKRFQADAQKLKVGRERSHQVTTHTGIDFFNDGESLEAIDRKRKAADPVESVKKLKKDHDAGVSESDEENATDEDVQTSDSSMDEDGDEQEEELTLLGTIKSSDKKMAKTKKKQKKLTVAKKSLVWQEKINHLRKINRIHVHGTDIVDPVTTFEALLSDGLHPRVVQNLHEIGFVEPTPIQMQAIPFMMQRRELLACAPTGSGKTAAFVIPVLHQLKEPRKLGFRALILSPTRELATQTYRVFSQIADGTGFRIQYIDKTSTAAKKFGPHSSQKFDILVTTPNRLVHMLQQEPPAISLKNVEWLIVDESDKLFEEGKRGFRDQLAAVYQACDGKHVRRAMFSATFAHDVEEWCKLHLDNVVQVYIGEKNSATETVEQELKFVGGEGGKRIAIRSIIQKGIMPPVLIFVQSKDRAQELFHELIYDGINVDVIHADRTQLQRDNIVKSFRSGRIWVLICTELMGRGIDFKGVNLVINYDLPTSAISYIHRIGRTGRAGRPGRAITLFTEDDAVNIRRIANVLKASGCHVPDYMLKLAAPRKRDQKKFARSAPVRKSISTVPEDDAKKEAKSRKLRKKILNGSKRKDKGKLGTSSGKSQSTLNKTTKKSIETVQALKPTTNKTNKSTSNTGLEKVNRPSKKRRKKKLKQ